jgi:uncharacterized protein HemY
VAAYTLGTEHARLANRLFTILQEEPDPVRRQIAIEILTVSHVLRMGNPATAMAVTDGIHKHVRQLVEQSFRYLATRE